jgi:hypothetical protein
VASGQSAYLSNDGIPVRFEFFRVRFRILGRVQGRERPRVSSVSESGRGICNKFQIPDSW